MHTSRWFVAAAVVVAAVSTFAHADHNSAVLRYSVAVDADRPNAARIVVRPRLYPGVEVTRELSAQPVHPYLFEYHAAKHAHGTYVDAYRSLDTGEQRLDENHSLVKAQRLYRSLVGITTQDLQAASFKHRVHRPISKANVAVIIRGAKEAVVDLARRQFDREDVLPARHDVAPTPAEPAEPQLDGMPKAKPLPKKTKPHWVA